MASWQLRLSYILLRPMKMLQGYMAKRITEDSLIRFRNWSESKVKPTNKGTKNIGIEEISVRTIPCYWFSDNTSSDDEVILFLHGGGFCFGWNRPYEMFCTQLIQASGISILAVDYRIAPEHRYPSAHNDCLSAYQWLLHEGYSPEQITIIGDSAGAHIALSLMQQLRDKKEELPYAGIFLSPSFDMTFTDKWIWKGKDSFTHPRFYSTIMPMYFENTDASETQRSPISGELAKLPECLVIAGEQDVMRSDAERFVEKAKSAKVKAELQIIPGAWHSWYLYPHLLPEAKRTITRIADFLGRE